jgi:predicted N-acetyltransferase YhbS
MVEERSGSPPFFETFSMKSDLFSYRNELPADLAPVEALNAAVSGPGRFAKTAYRLREGVPAEPSLSFVAHSAGVLAGSVRLTRVSLGSQTGLILGPLVVAPGFAGKGAGRTLVRIALDAAARQDYPWVMLVGDEPYYGPLGFRLLPGNPVTLPGPADPRRVLFAELQAGACTGLKGVIARAPVS